MNETRNNKYLIVTIIGALSFICILFLPMISIMGVDVSLISSFGSNSNFGIGDIAGMIAFIAAIASVFHQNKKIACISTIVAVCWLLLTMVSMLEVTSLLNVSVFEILGIGYWLSLVLGIANIVVAFKAE